MAHQCLKCGNSYPDGSPQILKGCASCKGTRFFYTDAPLDDAERAVVAKRTERDLEQIALGKGPVVEPRAPERRIPTKDELPLGSRQDWVELGPNYLRNVVEDVVKRAGEKKPVFRVGAAPPVDKPTLAQWIRDQGGEVDLSAPPKRTSVADLATDSGDSMGSGAPASGIRAAEAEGDLLDDLMSPEREVAWRDEPIHVQVPAAEPTPASAPTAPTTTSTVPVANARQVDSDAVPQVAPSADGDDVVYKRAPRPVPKPVSLAGVPVDASEDALLRAKAQRALAQASAPTTVEPVPAPQGATDTLYPEGQRPETVGIAAPGVYELDVKRLMEKNPIVVHKDGTYSLHLPSLMESVNRGKKRVR